jgi:alkylation response protein AidB-like acyl-CoA dehydrogenase
MADYSAPLADMRFALDTVARLPELAALPNFAHADADTVAAVMQGAASFASEIVAPLNRVGDKQGCRLENGVVRTPEGWADAYRAYVEGGWNAVAFDERIGGQGLPRALDICVTEMRTAANMAWSLNPMLTVGAVEALDIHGTDELKRRYLAKLVSGEWTASMNLTEPQAGSDVGAMRTRATREGDHYRIKGQKIFITYGEHDLTDNIVHMVLARSPDGPPGTAGLSLFLIPKYPVNGDGSLGARNDLRAVSLEHKLGIHGSPTCVMAYGDNEGAIGWLVGEENRGMECMFTMMNNARLQVGLQGLAIAERAYQQARDYARTRVQGKPVTATAPETYPIVHHPDVRRMLLSMRARIEAMRGLVYYAAAALDRAHRAPDPDARAHAAARADLLIPVVKAWCTDQGVAVASIGIQVHGGMGYIEETGAAQYYRDARIAPIYEGTNGIQANDLVGRKVQRDGGAATAALVEEMRAASGGNRTLDAGIDALEDATDWLVVNATERALTLSGAAPYLELMGLVAGGWLLALEAKEAQRRLDSGEGDASFNQAKLATAHFYDAHLLATAPALLPAIQGGNAVLGFDPESF